MRKLAAVLAIVFTITVPSFVFAQLTPENTGLNVTAQNAFDTSITNPDNSNISIFVGRRIIQPVIGLTGIFFLVLTVYSGVLWMTARGDTKQVDKAKTILVNSVIGALVIASAYMITNFVIGSIAPDSPPAAASVAS